MFGPKELMVVLVVLAIVLLVFGPKRIKSLGSELGNAIKGFRQAVRDKDAEAGGDGKMASVDSQAQNDAKEPEDQRRSASQTQNV